MLAVISSADDGLFHPFPDYQALDLILWYESLLRLQCTNVAF